jgi:hypothetical protein
VRKNTLYTVPVDAAWLRAELLDLKVDHRFADVSRRPKEGGGYSIRRVRWKVIGNEKDKRK